MRSRRPSTGGARGAHRSVGSRPCRPASTTSSSPSPTSTRRRPAGPPPGVPAARGGRPPGGHGQRAGARSAAGLRRADRRRPRRSRTRGWTGSARRSGPISWAVAVDDVDAARAALVEAGFAPRPVTEGSRRTPEGDTVAWRMCDVGPGPYDAGLPFLIEWTTPMPAGPADGPVVTYVTLTPPDPDRVADLLLAAGVRRACRTGRDGCSATPPGWGSRCCRWRRRRGPRRRGGVRLARGGGTRRRACGLGGARSCRCRRWSQHPGRGRRDGGAGPAPLRRERAAPGRGRGVRAPARRPGRLARPAPGRRPRPRGGVLPRARPRPLPAARGRAPTPGWRRSSRSGLGLGDAGAGRRGRLGRRSQHLRPTRATVLRGRDGTVPVVVAWAAAGGRRRTRWSWSGWGSRPTSLDRQPDCGCDACDTGSADLLSTVDDAFVLALSRRGPRRARGRPGRHPRAGRLERHGPCSGAGRSSGGWTTRPRGGVRTAWCLTRRALAADARQAIVIPPSTGSVWPVM